MQAHVRALQFHVNVVVVLSFDCGILCSLHLCVGISDLLEIYVIPQFAFVLARNVRMRIY